MSGHDPVWAGRHNPFETRIATGLEEHFVDVASLNAPASDLVLARAGAARRPRDGSGGPPPAGASAILLLGTAGAGKTHLFNRLRRLHASRIVFVLCRPDTSSPGSLESVLSAVVDALQRRLPSASARQADVIVGAVLATALGGDPRFPLTAVQELAQLPPEAREPRIEEAIERVLDEHPAVWPEYLRRLLGLPFLSGALRQATVQWLSGREPSDSELGRLGERSAVKERLRALQTLGVAASFGAPLVLFFDQLENLIDDDGARIQAHMTLFSELHDTVHGLVLVQMALDREWLARIEPRLMPSHLSRAREYQSLLRLPTPEEARELVRRRLDTLPDEERLAPFPWPLTPDQLERLSTAGMTPRQLVQSCHDLLEGGELSDAAAAPEPARQDDRLAEHWELACRDARQRVAEAEEQGRGVDASLLLDALEVACGLLVGTRACRGKKVHDADSLVVTGPSGEARVLFLQHRDPRSLSAVLRHLLPVAVPGRVLVLRQASLGVAPGWKAVREGLRELVRTAGRAFFEVPGEDIAALLAARQMLAAAVSQDLVGSDGRPVPIDDARGWVGRQLSLGGVRLLELFSAAAPPVAEIEAALPPLPVAVAPAASPRDSGAAARPSACAILDRLRVASVERLVSELGRLSPGTTRARVLEELRADPRVRWFGQSLVTRTGDGS